MALQTSLNSEFVEEGMKKLRERFETEEDCVEKVVNNCSFMQEQADLKKVSKYSYVCISKRTVFKKTTVVGYKEVNKANTIYLYEQAGCLIGFSSYFAAQYKVIIRVLQSLTSRFLPYRIQKCNLVFDEKSSLENEWQISERILAM